MKKISILIKIITYFLFALGIGVAIWGIVGQYGTSDSTQRSDDKKPDLATDYTVMGSFIDGHAKARAQSSRLWGIVSRDGRVVVPLNYQQIGNYREGRAPVKQNNRWGLVGQGGQLIIPVSYDMVAEVRENRVRTKHKGKYGFFDSHGRLIIPFQYDFAKDFQNGRAQVGNQGRYWMIDLTGKCISDC
jgi:hypothetical protein